MSQFFSVTVDTRDLARVARQFSTATKQQINKAKFFALKSTASQTKTQSARIIGKELNLKQRDIKADISGPRISGLPEQHATLSYNLQAIPVIRFGARRVARGVSFKIKRRKGRKTIKHAFIATVRAFSGDGETRAVFMRKGPPRLPIKKLMTTSVGESMINNIVPIAVFATSKLSEVFRSKLEFFSSR